MFKFIGKLVIIIVVLYALIQIPFFGDIYQNVKNSFNEKVGNVTEEVDRIKGKVGEVKDKVDEVKETAGEIKDKIVDTKEALEGTLDDVKNVADAITGLGGDEEENDGEVPDAEGAFDLDGEEAVEDGEEEATTE